MKFKVFILPATLLTVLLFIATGCSKPIDNYQDVPLAKRDVEVSLSKDSGFESDCNDGLDNDGDNLFDESDPDCSSLDPLARAPSDDSISSLEQGPAFGPSGGGSGGGGSQGALHNARTGNPDMLDKEEAVCLNGRQEVNTKRSRLCPHLLYGVLDSPNDDGDNGDGNAKLAYINETSGAATVVGEIRLADNTKYEEVRGLDFDSMGQLYALGIRASGQDTFWELLKVDCQNGLAELVGETSIDDGNDDIKVNDLTIDAMGAAYVFTKNENDDDDDDDNLYKLSLATAQSNVLGEANVTPYGQQNGLAAVGFPSPSQLYLGHDKYISELDNTNGSGTNTQVLTYTQPMGPYIIAMDQDFGTKRIYALVADTAPS